MYGLRSINNMYSEHAGQRWGLSVQRLDRGMNQPKTTAEPHAVAYAGWKPFPSIAVGSDFIIVGHPEFQQGKAQTPGQSQEISWGLMFILCCFLMQGMFLLALRPVRPCR